MKLLSILLCLISAQVFAQAWTIPYLHPAPGTRQRYTNDKLSENGVSPTDFGAFCDGVHDDSSAIQKAITAAGTGATQKWLVTIPFGCVGSTSVNPNNYIINDQRVGGAVPNYLAPFTGSVTRTLNNKLADVVNIKDFGARCDGITNDMPAIQLAINAACPGTAPGGVVIIPSGVCGITPSLGTTTPGVSHIQVPSFCTIRGSGKASELRVINNGNYQAILFNPGPVQQIQFDSFRINQQSANQQNAPIFVTGGLFSACVDGLITCEQEVIFFGSVSGAVVHNMYFDDMSGLRAIYLFNDTGRGDGVTQSPGPCTNATISNNYFRYHHPRTGDHGYGGSQAVPQTAGCTTGNTTQCVPLTITAASCTVGANCTATFTTAVRSPEVLFVGQPLVVSGVGISGYNNTWTVNTVPSNTTVTVVTTATSLGASSGGTLSNCCVNMCPNCTTDNSTIYTEGCGNIITENTFETDPPTAITPTISSISEGANNLVTVTMSAAHGLVVSQGISVSGVSSGGVPIPGYNGSANVVSVPSSTTFTYNAIQNGLPSGSSGTVKVYPSTSHAVTAMELHGGGYTAYGNTVRYYDIGFALVPSQTNIGEITPNNWVITNNTMSGTVGCIQMSGFAGCIGNSGFCPGGPTCQFCPPPTASFSDVSPRFVKNVLIANNNCNIANLSRGAPQSGSLPAEYYGILGFSDSSWENIVIKGNIFTFEKNDNRVDGSFNNEVGGGIVFLPFGSIIDLTIEGNEIRNSPYMGIGIVANNETGTGSFGNGLQPIIGGMSKNGTTGIVTVTCSTTTNCGTLSGCVTGGFWCHHMAQDQVIYVDTAAGDQTHFPRGFKRVTAVSGTTFSYQESVTITTTNSAVPNGIFPAVSKAKIRDNIVIDSGSTSNTLACTPSVAPCAPSRAAIQIGAMWPTAAFSFFDDLEVSNNFIRDTCAGGTACGAYGSGTAGTATWGNIALDLQTCGTSGTCGSRNVRAFNNTQILEGGGSFNYQTTGGVVTTTPAPAPGVVTPFAAGDTQALSFSAAGTATPDPSQYGRTQIITTAAATVTIAAPVSLPTTPFTISIIGNGGAATLTWNAAYHCNPACPASVASGNTTNINFAGGLTSGVVYETSRTTGLTN